MDIARGHPQSVRRAIRRLVTACAATTAGLALCATAAQGACSNPVACENAKAGSPPSAWQVSGAGDATIQGYATSMSVDRGQTVRFKVKTTANAYHIDVYRLGYYQGNGARLQTGGIRPSATLPQSQPACLTDAATGLIDCGNWGVSASWTAPADAVSGVYVARLVRDDTGGASLIPFVVRDDAGSSDVLVRTSDATWQAYNKYGGNSLYSCTSPCPPGSPGAYKGAFSVSYNRPFDGTITQDQGRSYLFYAEYQMIRFLERNGYDISYTSQADVDAAVAPLLHHRLIVSSGHDEYWSGRERANVEAARDAGVGLAFFSGNEVFWKTRWQASTADGGSVPNRTLTTYKDTHFNAPTDPTAWTGTWRDPRFSPPGDGGRPENSLTGQLFIVNAGASEMTVPAAYKTLRLWRNTAVTGLAAGQSRTLAPGTNTLGYEWDIDADNGFRPRGSFDLSSTTVSNVESFTDYGTTTKLGTTQTHHLTEYRAPSGALVFGAGTVQWAWGLDTTNAWSSAGPPPAGSADPVMQQATVNLLADMGAPATTLMAGLVSATPSADATAPTSSITSPTAGTALTDGSRITIGGTAADVGGTVAGVEVSTDGGSTWHPAAGTTSWSYSWVVHGSPSTRIMVRAVDDSGNLEASPATVSVDVGCPCSLFGPNAAPWVVDQGDTSAVELGVKFKSDLDGKITGIRFYKAAANTGTHVGSLWTTNGTLLARGTFTNESASGWQQMTFSTPVDVAAGTTYVASYYAPAGHYSASPEYFFTPSPVGGNALDAPPLHTASANGGGGPGVYSYGSSASFPTSTYDGENYSVDVSFVPTLPPGPVGTPTATAGPGAATVSFTAPVTGGPPASYVVTPYVGTVAQPPVTFDGTPPPSSVTIGALDPASRYTFTVKAVNANGSGPVSAPSNAVTPTDPTAPAAPTAVVAAAGNGQALVRWTPPADGGRTITRYTVTPYAGGVAQDPTTVTGSPAPASANVAGLANGTSYTFTVTATNSVGTGPPSAASDAVVPSVAPRFVQRVSGRGATGATLPLTPAAAITSGDRIVVTAGVWSAAGATISGVGDAAGNTYTKVTSVKAPDNTELSVWTAPVTAGSGTRPAITVTATGSADIGAAALEYAGLSTAAGTGAVDVLKTATGTSGAAGFVTSGPTAPVTGDNELAVGAYADSGFGRTLASDPGYTERVNVSPASDMEFLDEDAPAARGETPGARVSTGASTPWLMATVVFRGGGAAQPPALAVSPTSLTFGGTAGGPSPAARTISVSNPGGGTLNWTAAESASWLSLSPASGTDAGTITVTPSIAGLAPGTYTTDITVSAPGASGSPKTIPVTFTVTPAAPPSLSVSPTSLSFSAAQGGAAPAAKTLSVSNTGGGTMSWSASDDVAWLAVSPASGTDGGTITVTPSIAGLAAGTYTATVTVTAAGAGGSPATVPVTLTVGPAAPSSLVGAWGFDEASGTTATDASGRGNGGTLNGPSRTPAGRYGSALSFDGVNDWVSVPDANSLDLTTGMTLEAWVRPTAMGTLWRTVLLKEQASQLVYGLYAGDGRGRPAADVFNTVDRSLSGTTATPLDAWTHLAATYDGAALRLYVNGVQAASKTVNGAIRTSSGPLRIGGNGIWNDEWFTGLIDEVRVYNRALTAAEIQSDMTVAIGGG